MIRALHAPGSTASTLYINVGGMTNLAVAVGTTCVFTRVVANGTESIAGELAERRGLTLEHAHGWLRHVGLLLPVDDIDGDQEIVAEARSVLSEGVRRIADEVRNSLDFHTMQDGARRGRARSPDRARGGDPRLRRSARERRSGSRSRSASWPKGRPGAFGGIDAGTLAVAAGLTVERGAGMRAVNLIPSDAKRGGGKGCPAGSPVPATLVIACWRSRSCS